MRCKKIARESVKSEENLGIKQSFKEVESTTEKTNDFFMSVLTVEKSGRFFHWNSFLLETQQRLCLKLKWL